MVVAESSKGAWDVSGVCFDMIVHGFKIRLVGVSYQFFE